MMRSHSSVTSVRKGSIKNQTWNDTYTPIARNIILSVKTVEMVLKLHGISHCIEECTQEKSLTVHLHNLHCIKEFTPTRNHTNVNIALKNLSKALSCNNINCFTLTGSCTSVIYAKQDFQELLHWNLTEQLTQRRSLLNVATARCLINSDPASLGTESPRNVPVHHHCSLIQRLLRVLWNMIRRITSEERNQERTCSNVGYVSKVLLAQLIYLNTLTDTVKLLIVIMILLKEISEFEELGIVALCFTDNPSWRE